MVGDYFRGGFVYGGFYGVVEVVDVYIELFCKFGRGV